jgi:hypothetical protein
MADMGFLNRHLQVQAVLSRRLPNSNNENKFERTPLHRESLFVLQPFETLTDAHPD